MTPSPYESDPRFLRLVAALALPRAFVLGLVQTVVMRCYVAGTDLLGTNEIEAEQTSDWPGRPGEFIKHFGKEYATELNGKWYLRGKRLWAMVEVNSREVKRDPAEQAMELTIETGMNVSDSGLAIVVTMVSRHGIDLVREAIQVAISKVGRSGKCLGYSYEWLEEKARKRIIKAERMRQLGKRARK